MTFLQVAQEIAPTPRKNWGQGEPGGQGQTLAIVLTTLSLSCWRKDEDLCQGRAEGWVGKWWIRVAILKLECAREITQDLLARGF